MRYSRILTAGLFIAAALSSCTTQYEAILNSNDVDTKYEAAFH